MDIRCDAEALFANIENLLMKLSDEKVTASEDAELHNCLDKYWNVECPLAG